MKRTRRRAAEHAPHYGRSGYARIPNDAYFTVDERCGPALTDRVELREPLWEPCCGAFDLVKQLRAAGYRRIVCSDIVRYAPGAMRQGSFFDFRRPLGAARSIVFNPPNKLSRPFVEHALQLMRPVGGIVAALLRLEWDATPGRLHLLGDRHPAHALNIKLSFRPWWSRTDRRATPREAWQWHVWDWRNREPARVRYA